MRFLILACAATALLAGCGGGSGGGTVQLGGQSIAQTAVNCTDAPTETPFMGLTLANASEYPNAEQRNEIAGGFDAGGVPYAAFAPASGGSFYGFPIEGAVNDAWIVTAPVDEVAAAVLREQGLDSSLDQLRAAAPVSATSLDGTYTYVSPPGFKTAMFYGEASDSYGEYDATWANQASGDRYNFTQASEAYVFPESTAERTGFIHQISLWRLSDTQTLARCYVRDPTVG